MHVHVYEHRCIDICYNFTSHSYLCSKIWGDKSSEFSISDENTKRVSCIDLNWCIGLTGRVGENKRRRGGGKGGRESGKRVWVRKGKKNYKGWEGGRKGRKKRGEGCEWERECVWWMLFINEYLYVFIQSLTAISAPYAAEYTHGMKNERTLSKLIRLWSTCI